MHCFKAEIKPAKLHFSILPPPIDVIEWPLSDKRMKEQNGLSKGDAVNIELVKKSFFCRTGLKLRFVVRLLGCNLLIR